MTKGGGGGGGGRGRERERKKDEEREKGVGGGGSAITHYEINEVTFMYQNHEIQTILTE